MLFSIFIFPASKLRKPQGGSSTIGALAVRADLFPKENTDLTNKNSRQIETSKRCKNNQNSKGEKIATRHGKKSRLAETREFKLPRKKVTEVPKESPSPRIEEFKRPSTTLPRTFNNSTPPFVKEELESTRQKFLQMKMSMTFVCEYCYEKFPTESSHYNHMKEKHRYHLFF